MDKFLAAVQRYWHVAAAFVIGTVVPYATDVWHKVAVLLSGAGS